MVVIGAFSSFRELGEMSPHKRPSIHRLPGFLLTVLFKSVSEVVR